MRGARSGRWPGRAVAATLLASVLAGTMAVIAPESAQAHLDEAEPGQQQVQLAYEQAAALRRQEREQQTRLAGADAALQAAAKDSAIALEAYRAAADTRRAALTELAALEAELAAAEEEITAERARLARWAREAYVDGGSLGLSPALYTLLAGGTTDDVATRRIWLQRSGRSRADVLDRLRAAAERRRAAIVQAERAAVAAEAAAAQADAALAARDAVLAEHRRSVAERSLALDGARRAAQAAARDADLATARLSAGVLPGAGDGNRATGPVGDCPGLDVSGYPNGRIPREALCPLDGTAGGLLRADAAHAFNRLTAAFAGRFGRPLCLTDSYRSFEEQVQVRAARPGLAAVPGRSNHGWGIAVDLCGGVERFDSPEHTWMRLHAPLFGWFHPAWAQRAGSLPEPWHWEFSG